MRAELQVPFAAILGFVLVLSRILGVFVFLPLPGKESGPSIARIVLAFAMALAVFPQYAMTAIGDPTPSLICFWLASELALGLTVGLLISFLAEFLTVGAHVLALQAGYAYASVVDPTTQADSEVLQVFAQLIGGFLFFTTGLDHLAIRTFSMSLHSFPPGQFLLTKDLSLTVIVLSSSIFSIGLKLALPVVALLLMTEIALALVARLSAQLQLGFNASAIKMMLTLLVLASILQVIPRLYEGYAAEIAHALIHYFQPGARFQPGTPR